MKIIYTFILQWIVNNWPKVKAFFVERRKK